MAQEAAKPKGVSIASLVKEAWQGNEGDMPSAAVSLYSTIARDQLMLNEILPSVLKAWCREQIGDYVGDLRLAALRTQEEPSQGTRLRAVITATLFDFPLPGGKRLGDANAREIAEGAQAYRDTADDAAHKSRWLSLVAERVGRKNRAETALTLPQLEELFEEAKND